MAFPCKLHKTVKLWKISERDKRPEGYNLKDDDGRIRDPSTITSLRVKNQTQKTPTFNTDPECHADSNIRR
ncbi:Serine/threonine-protein phosphatase 2A regulatory subunit B beta isoform [Liparis tanakae]|uniref:Serine/threonine-protein phosphatase 2A regulatory subunit B beta isoform n=1 Tax=Liparis tanakae TaxID=230148 RepID=A0A4Z2E2X4_9TELE|nr:Serine/threonine-protein phosphatase 2A regulatory subunit B beta isoform [Liparis tanakae]